MDSGTVIDSAPPPSPISYGFDPSPKRPKPTPQPNIVPVNLGADDDDEPDPVPVALPPAVPVKFKVNWELINNDSLSSLLKPPDKSTKNGNLYLTFDVDSYEQSHGEQVRLGRWRHLIVETPYMSNLFGLGTRSHLGTVSHSMCLDLTDTLVDKKVLQFAQFLARCDAHCLQLSINAALSWDVIKSQVSEWSTFCTNEKGEVDLAKFSSIVRGKFSGALRQSKKSKDDPKVLDKHVSKQADGSFNVPSQFFFRTKIDSKRANSKLPDVTCYDDKNRHVYFAAERDTFKDANDQMVERPVLCAFRATYVKAQVELSAINFVQKEFYATWKLRKLKYKTRKSVETSYAGEDTSAVCDFDDQEEVVYTSAADIERVKEEESQIDIDETVGEEQPF